VLQLISLANNIEFDLIETDIDSSQHQTIELSALSLLSAGFQFDPAACDIIGQELTQASRLAGAAYLWIIRATVLWLIVAFFFS